MEYLKCRRRRAAGHSYHPLSSSEGEMQSCAFVSGFLWRKLNHPTNLELQKALRCGNMRIYFTSSEKTERTNTKAVRQKCAARGHATVFSPDGASAPLDSVSPQASRGVHSGSLEVYRHMSTKSSLVFAINAQELLSVNHNWKLLLSSGLFRVPRSTDQLSHTSTNRR